MTKNVSVTGKAKKNDPRRTLKGVTKATGQVGTSGGGVIGLNTRRKLQEPQIGGMIAGSATGAFAREGMKRLGKR